ncbi:hypothetical protein E2C01_012532 [Portunus trituberculatus]|uniref:Integrase catalytic domain-containing protein n=1 Tax=Portunus trituberculatus TaxID=210409 RepID=A0A5B7DED1_PORTR|nr:hypothetical protein [Portunus trituberculatus]
MRWDTSWIFARWRRKPKETRSTSSYRNVWPMGTGLSKKIRSHSHFVNTSECGTTSHAKGAWSCTHLMRNTRGLLSLQLSGMHSLRTSMWDINEETRCCAGQDSLSSGQGSMPRWSKRGGSEKYVIHMPPPAPQRPSCPPHSHSTHSSRRFGIPEELLCCDGGTNLTSQESKDFFNAWRIQLRISSACYPQSNSRAEVAVKSVKRLLCGNTAQNRSLDTDGVARAMMQCLNTPLQGSEVSLAQLLTEHQVQDAIPVDASLYKTAHNLKPLVPHQWTRIQNPGSDHWDRVGTILEITVPRQYLVRLNGSGRATIRNRRHLHLFRYEPTYVRDEGVLAIPEPFPPTQGRPQHPRQAPRHLSDYIFGDATLDDTH